MNKLVFEFTEDEINMVIQSIAKQPYETVFGLINKIQKQAQSQLVPQQPTLPMNSAAITTKDVPAKSTKSESKPVKSVKRTVRKK